MSKERDILEKLIADGKEAESKLAELEVESKPPLRDGNYGIGSDGRPSIFLDPSQWPQIDDPVVFHVGRHWNYAGECKGEMDTLGNIFDDIERRGEDLEEFNIKNQGGNDLSVRRVRKFGMYRNGIEFAINNNYGQVSTASINQAIEIHQKLGQIIATAKRKEAKK